MSAVKKLSISKDGEVIKSLAIDGEAVLGRGDGCVIRLDDRAISRQHAVFRMSPEGVEVEKKSEFAPLFVNGVDCTSAVVREGDVIAIGPYLVKIEQGEAGSSLSGSPLPLGAQGASALGDSQLGSAPKDFKPEAFELNSDIPDAPDVALDGAQSQLAQGLDASDGSNESPGGAEDGIVEIGFDQPVGDGTPESQESSGESSRDPNAPRDEISADSLISAGGSDEPLGIESAPIDTGISQAGVDSEAPTRVVAAERLDAKLIFPAGAANVSEIVIGQTEVVLGREKECSVILTDKKASRRHVSFKRDGVNILIKDLGSANGTYVNGSRVIERQLAGGDVIRIGSSEFTFQAESKEFKAQAQELMQVASESTDSQAGSSSPSIDGVAFDTSALEAAQGASAGALEGLPAQAASGEAELTLNFEQPGLSIPGITDNGGIPGMDPSAASGKKPTLLEKFRALPPRRQAIYGFFFIAGFYYLAFDEGEITPQPVAKPAPIASGVPVPGGVGNPSAQAKREFESLTADKKEFVKAQHAKALEKFRADDPDGALFEVNQIFQYVSNYEQAREIEQYAKERQRQKQVQIEEARKQAERERIKTRVAELVTEVSDKMSKKQYLQSRELFPKILDLDPENPQVPVWDKEIRDWEQAEAERIAREQARAAVNQQAWNEYKAAVVLMEKGDCFKAISAFQRVGKIEAVDRKPAQEAEGKTAECFEKIAAKRDPLLAEARESEGRQEFKKAFDSYKAAYDADPMHAEAPEGMNRIRRVLNEKARAVYTEAVLAESYSDFRTAAAKYKETLEIAPSDDIYYERAARKLSRIEMVQPSGPQSGGDASTTGDPAL